MINSAMTLTLYNFYDDTKEPQPIDRKEVKVIVDSLIEQLCQHYFQRRPNGVENIRTLINSSIVNFTNAEDKAVLKNLNKLLREYKEAFSSGYSDHKDTFEYFIKNELKCLTSSIIHHSCLEDEHIKTLRKTI
jgi:hypothetical protein